ncbi:response regulator transcription factor [Rhodococcus triatomae]|uniref:DNA-binding response regulator, NarL/FixJ family, contains REC and HTH domains n=1 Tax=Rhodococcus triatomae TaxID=300028 RepID=A0A1G7ZK90_9NOCA|nr:response regulator transcription factor [Rhodococcus triatomae]QNG18017.1 response regulator transcription factor [Rhodococcus triatomae]QNG22314.1 response regulator transcription factor [Rhodococcus triatomae]SDH09133.1 DNA-binding response regulator, NarL/FixJ family, contains REC and HTH domains [Rhodococcus triatomae]
MTPEASPSLRIAVADDSPLLRAGVEAVIESAGHVVCGSATDADILVDVVSATAPDLVITDVRMPPTHTDEGLRAAATLRRNHPGLPVVVLSQYISVAYLGELLDRSEGGAIGYLLKDRVGHVRHFVESVEAVAGGATIVDPDVVRALVGRSRRGGLRELTPREREVLALMAEGQTNAGIARTLVVSEGAVRKHVGAIFAKLPVDGGDRRVRAVLSYLREAGN